MKSRGPGAASARAAFSFRQDSHNQQRKAPPVNPRYQIVIYWSDNDRGFVAEVPELDGLEVLGESCEEALAKVQTAIADWIERARSEGEEIPEPLGRVEVAAKTAPKTGRAGRRQERIDKRRRRREKGRRERRDAADRQ